jgi:hypothetical protein
MDQTAVRHFDKLRLLTAIGVGFTVALCGVGEEVAEVVNGPMVHPACT